MAAAEPVVGPHSRADWHLDPNDPGLIRYWDGRSWTPYTLPTPAGWGTDSTAPRPPWAKTWRVAVPVGLALSLIFLAGGCAATDTDPAPPGADGTAARGDARSGPSEAPPSEPAAAVSEPVTATMPAVAGLPRKEAMDLVSSAGLVVSEVRKVPSAEARGTVLRQGKPSGASLLAGSGVVLVTAAPYPRVPGVVGESQAVATSMLREAGFRVRVTTETVSSGKNDVVLRQTSAGSQRAKPRSVITIVKSSVVRPAPPPPPAQECTAGYDPCLTPASDYDCAGGSGDGPEYAYGPIYVTGSDPYDLDRDGDGVACES